MCVISGSRWRYCVILILLKIDSLFARKLRWHCAVSLHAVIAQQRRLPTVRMTGNACVSARFVLGWVTTYNIYIYFDMGNALYFSRSSVINSAMTVLWCVSTLVKSTICDHSIPRVAWLKNFWLMNIFLPEQDQRLADSVAICRRDGLMTKTDDPERSLLRQATCFSLHVTFMDNRFEQCRWRDVGSSCFAALSLL